MTQSKPIIRPLAIVIGLFIAAVNPAVAQEGPGNPGYAPLGYWPQAPESQPGSEMADIVFVIDGSSSIDEAFALQKEGIKNCLVGPDKFIDYDGSVAVGVIQFSTVAEIEIHLTVIDSEATAISFNNQVDGIGQMDDLTSLEQGLDKAIELFETEASGQDFVLVVSTDINYTPEAPQADPLLQLGSDIKTRSGEADGMAFPARICTVYVDEICDGTDPATTGNPFLRLLANTLDSGDFTVPPVTGPAYPNQKTGHFQCARNLLYPSPGVALEDFVLLCEDCSCYILNAGGDDCNSDGVPDVCDPDCNGNEISDVCDILNGTSIDCNSNMIPDECELDCNTNGVPDECDVDPSDPDGDGEVSDDCNSNGIPDECEPDCNTNGVSDECDIRDGTSNDWNHNGVPDECEIGPGVGDVVYVDQNPSVPGPRDGTSWDKAYETLAEGLAAAGGTKPFIYVANGSYKPDDGPGRTPGNRTETFQLLDSVAVVGDFAGYGDGGDARDIDLYETILSGDIGTVGNKYDNSYHVVTADTVNATAVLDGFTITDGYASVAGMDGAGGGIHCDDGSPSIWNCRISGNYAIGGAGVYCFISNPVITNCSIVGNSASIGSGEDGGGIWIQNGYPTITNCSIKGNTAEGSGGGICGSAYITKCAIAGNSAGIDGGGIHGNGMLATSCMIHGNSAVTNGGGVLFQYGDEAAINCTIAGNSAPLGGGIYCTSGSPVITNCIIWGNTPGQIGGTAPMASYSDVQGGVVGESNLDSNPLFVDADGPDDNAATWQDNDYHLNNGSPCVNLGLDDAVSTAQDFEGDDRIQYCRVDIGADESPYYRDCNTNATPDACESPLLDCNSNGIHDMCDINEGTSSDCNTNVIPDECEAIDWVPFDYDRDCDVDLVDFAHLQACFNFGGVAVGCQDADADVDDDVDFEDRDAFIACAAGAAVVPNADCSQMQGEGMSMPPPGGEEMMMEELVEGETSDAPPETEPESTPEPEPVANVSASFVLHGSEAGSVQLPAVGGRILVDLVVTTDNPIIAWEGMIGVDTPGVVTINASDWNHIANVLFSHGVPGYDLASYYDCTLIDWFLLRRDSWTATDSDDWWVDGELAPGVTLEEGTDPMALLEPGTTALIMGYDLDALDGPIQFEWPFPTEYGTLFVAQGRIGALAASALPPGTTTVATLSLNIAGASGTYPLYFFDGMFVEETDGMIATWPIAVGPAFQITVNGN